MLIVGDAGGARIIKLLSHDYPARAELRDSGTPSQ